MRDRESGSVGRARPTLLEQVESKPFRPVLRAGSDRFTRDAANRPVVVHEVGAAGDRLRVVGLDGRDPRALAGDPEGRRLVAAPARSAGGAEHGRAWVLFGPDGRLPIDGSLPPLLRHVPDGRTVPFDEVSR